MVLLMNYIVDILFLAEIEVLLFKTPVIFEHFKFEICQCFFSIY